MPGSAHRLGAPAGAYPCGAAAAVPEVWRRDEDRRDEDHRLHHRGDGDPADSRPPG